MPLSFLDELDDAQVDAANKIASKAKELGVDPKLAVAMAYAESRLRMNTGDSKKGAIGVMQITPATGQDMKLSEEDLRNPDVNIDAGVKILKKHLNKYPDDPRLALVAYNYGPSSDFFSGGELPAETKKYIKDVIGYGGLANFGVNQTSTTTDEGVAPEQAPVSEPTLSQAPQFGQDSDYSLTPPPPPPAPEPRGATPEEIKERLIAGGLGGLTGLGISGVLGGRGVLNKAGEVFGKGLMQGSQQASALQSVTPPTTPPGVFSGTAPAGGSPVGPAISGGQSTGGSGTANWGKKFGLGEIEANRATAMGNAPGSADELIKARADALKRLQGMAPASGMAEDPTRGGLMVPKQTPYTGPRGPQGQIGGAKPPPVEPVVPKVGALERVTGVLQSFINNPITRYASKLRVLTPPLALAGAGERAAEVAQELRNPNPDYTSALLKGGSAAGMLLTPFQPEIGLPLTGLSEGALYLRGNSPKGTFSYKNPTGQEPR
jgi:hypothetical protein